MSRIRALLVLALCAVAPQLFLPTSSNAQGIPQNIPRKELLILENPEGTIKNAGWFNIWAINAGSQSNGLQQAGARYPLVHRSGKRPRRRLGQLAGRPTSRNTMPTSPK